MKVHTQMQDAPDRVVTTAERPEADGDGAGRPAGGRRWARRIVQVGLTLLVLSVAYLAVTFAQVWRASSEDEAGPADAIVVLGAAQYDGRPSPVLAARLDHAIDLYEQGIAPIIVVTGGQQPGDRFTEAEASTQYMTERGVPAEVIVRENEARSSFGSLQAVSDELASRGMQRVVLVSDPYHSYRIEAMADDLGLDAGVSPTRRSPTGGTSRWKALLRETAAVSAGRIVGWDTLVDLEHSY